MRLCPAASACGDTPHCTTDTAEPAPRAERLACSACGTATLGGGCAATMLAGRVIGDAALGGTTLEAAHGGRAPCSCRVQGLPPLTLLAEGSCSVVSTRAEPQ